MKNRGTQKQLSSLIHNHPGKVSTSVTCLDEAGRTQSASDTSGSGTNLPALKIRKQTFFGSDGKIKYQVSFAFNGVWQPERIFDTISERVHFVNALSGGSKIYKGEETID